MKEIIFVTTNKGKIASAKGALDGINVIPYNAELIEPRGDDVKEIAKQKVIQAYNIVKKPCISLDAGFYIKSLKGFPKAYVNHMLDTIGIEGILKLMEDINERYCEFRACIAYYDGVDMTFFESKSPGYISETVRGTDNKDKWSDLWYIFIPKHFEKTLAEFTDEDFDVYTKMKDDSCMNKFGRWYMEQ